MSNRLLNKNPNQNYGAAEPFVKPNWNSVFANLFHACPAQCKIGYKACQTKPLDPPNLAIWQNHAKIPPFNSHSCLTSYTEYNN